jgi:aspartate dehydrogenase
LPNEAKCISTVEKSSKALSFKKPNIRISISGNLPSRRFSAALDSVGGYWQPKYSAAEGTHGRSRATAGAHRCAIVHGSNAATQDKEDTVHPSPLNITLIGFGAIGRAVFQRATAQSGLRIRHVVVRPAQIAAVQGQLGDAAQACVAVPADAKLVLECAGHGAITDHVLPALIQGVECAVLSIGALCQPGLAEQLAAAAQGGGTQLHLLGGAIGGIDALAAARFGGLMQVSYTGRKPVAGWRGTPAEQVVNLDALSEATVILQGSAREAACLYPKNANVAAMVALAGLGLDQTRVRLIADPQVTANVHEIDAVGDFGELHLVLRGKPLADNPKTSALTVLCALRFLHNRVAALTL